MGISTANLTGKRCQCTVCGEIFSTETNFEKHRKGDYSKGRECVNPVDVGLVLGNTATGTVWQMPSRFEVES